MGDVGFVIEMIFNDALLLHRASSPTLDSEPIWSSQVGLDKNKKTFADLFVDELHVWKVQLCRWVDRFFTIFTTCNDLSSILFDVIRCIY
jgi:hypothetical protein